MLKNFFRHSLTAAAFLVSLSVDASAETRYCTPVARWGVEGVDCPFPLDSTLAIAVQNRCWYENEAFDPTNPLTDHLTDAKSHVRLDWAIGCGYIGAEARTKKLFHFFFDPLELEWQLRSSPGYPHFAFRDSNLTMWKPESLPQYPLVPESCLKPSAVTWAKVCNSYDRY